MKEKYIENRKNKEGKISAYKVHIKFPDGRQYTKTFPTKDFRSTSACLKAAVKERNRVMTEYEMNQFSDSKERSITVQSIFEMIPDYTSKRTASYVKYKKIYNKWIAPEFANKAIDCVTRADIEKTLKLCAETCCRQHVSNVLTIWRNIFGIAVYDLDLPIKDRTQKIDFPECRKVSNRSKEEHNISEEEFSSFVEFMSQYGNYLPDEMEKIYNRNIMLYCLRLNRFLGLRPQEIRALSKEDVQFLDLEYYDEMLKRKITVQGIKVHVVRSVGSTLTDELALTNLKTAGSERNVFGGAEARKIVEEVLAYCKTDILFADYNGNLISSTRMADYVRRVKRAWQKKTGSTTDIYSVLMRKSLSADNCRNSVNQAITRDLMGHASVETSLNWYTSTSEQEQIDAILNRKFKK